MSMVVGQTAIDTFLDTDSSQQHIEEFFFLKKSYAEAVRGIAEEKMKFLTDFKQVSDSINIALRKATSLTSTVITAGQLKDDQYRKQLIQADKGYQFLQTVRGSPAYCKKKTMYDLLGMIKQLGPITLFLTLSAADLRWPETICIIADQFNVKLTKEDVENMSWEERCSLIRKNPITAARQFDYRVQQFVVLVIKARVLGNISDYYYRVEFQQRGSPHIHMVLWSSDAPDFESAEEQVIADFVDLYISCNLPDEEDDEKFHSLVNSLKRHVHSQICRKTGKKCRLDTPDLHLIELSFVECQQMEWSIRENRRMCTSIITTQIISSNRLHNKKPKGTVDSDDVDVLGNDDQPTTVLKLQDKKGYIPKRVTNVVIRTHQIIVKPKSNSLFGGVLVIMLGGLYQLPPVGQRQVYALQKSPKMRLYGSLWQHVHITMLSKLMRQEDDIEFANLLNRIRTETHTKDDIEVLMTRQVTTDDPHCPTNYLHVFTLNSKGDQHNEKHIASTGHP
ncbi:unnamed protein product [Mytilus coruscus]|uniref:ATP-dependent DNA helicase n=1 Tax=Mytilus coruscus TaxID=42192 RepID=A0A6J8CW90_MYTCO|nr:unnamed protein product [Mytilus coruscus]